MVDMIWKKYPNGWFNFYDPAGFRLRVNWEHSVFNNGGPYVRFQNAHFAIDDPTYAGLERLKRTWKNTVEARNCELFNLSDTPLHPSIEPYVGSPFARRDAPRINAVQLNAPLLKPDERGLVLAPQVMVDGEGAVFRLGLNRDQVRLALLFWDRIESPNNDLFDVGMGPETDFLEAEGLLSRSLTDLEGTWDADDLLIQLHLRTFQELEHRDPGRWSLARGYGTLMCYDEADLVPARGTLVKLHRAIAVPAREVPLDDVLEFRMRRRPELLSLRHYLERLYQQIEAAPDSRLAEATEVAALDVAMADHIKAIKETGFRLRLASLEAKLDVSTFLTSAGAALAASQGASMPVTATLLAGAAASAISFETGVGLKDKRSTATPFEYVTYMHNEL